MKFAHCMTLLAVLGGSAWLVSASDPPFQRIANTTLNLPANLPRFDFGTQNAFPNLSFNQPLGIVSPPGDDGRLFILEKPGIVSVVPDLENPSREVFLDLRSVTASNSEEGALGLAFHPNYAENRYFYLFYTPRGRGGSGREDRLSRFEIDPNNPNRALRDSELVLFSQADDASNHNGGDIHFGPDGYLYVSLGDEGAGNDSLNNSQLITKDLFAGILRIDVDKRPGSLEPTPHSAKSSNYAIPPDNPYVGATEFLGRPIEPEQVHTEFWAVGLRNPWRMSFDPVTGILYAGDVGQGAREEIDIIVKGGNYGWAYREGTLSGPKGREPRGAEFIEPIHEYPRSQGVSVTGGVVYRGGNIPELYGKYIFADYGSGRIWSLIYNGETAESVEQIANDSGIAGFGVDPRNGDVLLADIEEGRIKRLVRKEPSGGGVLPERLSETGAFQDLSALTPNPGIVPYDINAPFWSDHAQKTRWFAVPDPDRSIAYQREGSWSFPAGSIWVKHFELETVRGDPESRRRLETRFIVRNATSVYGVTYRWNEEQTDAVLVPEEGMDEEITVREDEEERVQVWRYPSRTQCLVCHAPAGGLALGFNTAQLNREKVYASGVEANQIQALSQAGYFQSPVGDFHGLPKLAPPDDDASSLEWRVRSYLDSNCSQCHSPGGISQASFDARWETSTPDAGLIDGMLNDFGDDPENRVVKRGEPGLSMLLQRISTRDAGKMPPLASNELDPSAIQLLTEWIDTELTSYLTYSEWRAMHFSGSESEAGEMTADPDGDGASNFVEQLTHTDPNDGEDFRKAGIALTEEGVQVRFDHPANRAFLIEQTDSLHPPDWEPAGDGITSLIFPATGRSGEWMDSLPLDGDRYYRVRIMRP